MYAKDFADAVWFSLPRIKQMPHIINIGRGEDHSIFDYYKEISKILGFQGSFTFNLSKPIGMRQKLLEVKKINDLGWFPRNNLELGIKKTYSHYLECHR